MATSFCKLTKRQIGRQKAGKRARTRDKRGQIDQNRSRGGSFPIRCAAKSLAAVLEIPRVGGKAPAAGGGGVPAEAVDEEAMPPGLSTMM